VFDKASVDAIKEVVALFEVFARDQFTARVSAHEELVRQSGRGVFQRLDDVDTLFSKHAGGSISTRVSEDVWSRLQVVFQQRHVLVQGKGSSTSSTSSGSPTHGNRSVSDSSSTAGTPNRPSTPSRRWFGLLRAIRKAKTGQRGAQVISDTRTEKPRFRGFSSSGGRI
jgi:hypothetical protein